MEGPLEGPLENGGDMCSKEEEPMLIKPEDKEKVETPPPPVIIKFSDLTSTSRTRTGTLHCTRVSATTRCPS